MRDIDAEADVDIEAVVVDGVDANAGLPADPTVVL